MPTQQSTPTLNFDSLARRFLENTDAQTRLVIVTEIRDNIEIVHSPEYSSFLTFMFPVFYNVLRQGAPQFNDGMEQKIRNMILEILSRLPTTDLLKQFVPNLLKLAMYLLEVENEENAVICLRIIIDLHKSYRPSLMADVQAFLDIVLKIYTELPKTVLTAFKDKPASPPSSNSSSSGMSGGVPGAGNQVVSAISETSKPTTLIASTSSFKVLTECPIIVVLLFQLYVNFAPTNVPKFMPLIIHALNLNPPPNARHTHHAAYVDFIAAQVKTLSFLAYLLRGHSEHVKNYLDVLPKCVIQLLTNCPNESAATRKELLIATRHILATEFRSAFIPHIDPLLDEKVWIGSGRTSYESLRPLAYSTLADLVHHIRAELTLNQLARVVFLYTKNLHDTSLPFSIMTMSVKLLLHLVEFIPRRTDPNDPGKARYLLVRVLDSFANKFISLKRYIPKLSTPPAQTESQEGQPSETSWADTVKDCRTLLRTLVLGLKNIVWGITNCSPNYRNVPPGTQGTPPPVKVMNVEETLIFIRLLKNGLKCFAVFSAGPTPSPSEEKETLEHFASVYTMVAPHIFMDVFSMLTPYLYDCTLENQAMLAIPQHFLTNPGVSKVFAEILLNFLMDRIKNLSGTDKVASNVLLRLFKLVFGSIPHFTENESVLQPHLATIVTSAMKYASEVKESLNYFALLRSLFRSIGGGKFDLFMKEFLPLLPGLLEGLNKLQNSSHTQSMKELFVELSLTVPVRLSLFLPCLPLLIKPLVLALESNSELATQGLRTLDMMVDNITNEYLETLIAEVKPDLLKAVWRHLKPPPYPNGHVAIRILGKLSGRCRVPVLMGPPIPNEEITPEGLTVTVNFEPSVTVSLTLGKCVNGLKKTLMQSTDATQQKFAFQFLRYCLLLLMNPAKIDSNQVMELISNRDVVVPIPTLSVPLHTSIRDKLLSEVGVCKLLLEASIIAASNEKLRPETMIFFEHVCRHFAILFAMRLENPHKSLVCNVIDPIVLIDTFIQVLTLENRTYTKTVLDGIDILVQSLNSLRGAKETVHPIFNHLAQQLSHACYQKPWHVKAGACAGISLVCAKLPPQWVRTHEVLFVKALLFLLKDLPPELSVGTVEEASQTLALVIKVCNSHADNAQTDEGAKVFNDVVQALAAELFTPHPTVRKNVQSSLEQLAELTGHEVTELLMESRTALLIPVFSKPLRAQPLYVQIGHIEALTYCLGLRPPLLDFSAELLRLLKEALAIAEIDDTQPQTKLPSHKSHTQLINLRVVAIELMSAAMSCPEFQSPEHQEFRNQIIGMFFKALTFRAKEVVAVAKSGLSQVITQHKLAKELLQSSLRPVLLNLQNHSKLTVSLLQGLAKLLELLTNCFNVTLGEKLLELLTKWTTEPAKREETKVACAIIEIFHLLPNAAVKFLENLVSMTVSLENQLPREINSPYRAPLSKFLNKYPGKALDLFLNKLSQPAYSKMFRFVIRSELAGPLREELAKNPQKLISVTFQKSGASTVASTPSTPQTSVQSPQQPAEAPSPQPTQPGGQPQAPPELQFQGLLLVRTLVKHIPDWIGQNPTVLECLMDIWKSPSRMTRLQSDQVLPQHYLRESKIIIKCFLNYCRAHKEEIDVLFQMLSIFTVRTTVDFSFLRDFYTHEVAEGYTPEQKKTILSRFLQFFKDSSIAQDHKVQAFQILITPLLTSAFQKKEGALILDPAMISSVVSEILESEQQQTYEEALNIELLQLATLLVRNMTQELVDHRKDLIKFAWGHLKSEDTTSKQCAYVLVCRFIEAYETPPKIILQVYVALLRSYQLEARSLVRQALDILTPALKKRLGPADAKYPPWIKWTKKIIVEEGHALPQLIHILLLLVRHPQLFYPCRAQFVPPMVNSLARIGLVSNTSYENKKLAVDLAELVIKWENQRIKEGTVKTEPTPMSVEVTSPPESAATPMTTEVTSPQQTPQTPAQSGPDEEYKPQPGIIELVVHFLIRMASTASDAREVSGLPERSLELLKQALTVWPDVFVKFNYFEKLLSPAVEQPSIVCTGLSILNVILDYQLHNFVLPNINQLKEAIVPSLTSDNPKIIAPLCVLLKKIMKAFPLSDPTPEMAGFYGRITEILENNLQSYEKGNFFSIMGALKTMSEEMPEYLDRFLPALVKLVQKLQKDHVTPTRDTAETAEAGATASTAQATPATPGAPSQPATPSAPGVKTEGGRGAAATATAANAAANTKKPAKDTGSALLRAINLIALRVSHLNNDLRKHFFQYLQILIEKSQDVELLIDITKMITQWITGTPAKDANNNNNNNAPTKDSFTFFGKEKIALMLKMSRFDQIASTELQGLYLDLVYHVFSDTTSSRSEQAQLEAGFMMGLRSKDPVVRNNFFELFHKSIGSGLVQRLQYIFANQNWETLGGTYWMRPALELILASITQANVMTAENAPGVKLPQIPTVNAEDAHMNGKMETEPSQEALDLLKGHSEFLESIATTTTTDLILPLRELFAFDSSLVHQLWVQVFSTAWGKLAKEEQTKLTKPIVSLLAKDYHTKQQGTEPNVVQTILEGIAQCNVPVKLPVDVVRYLSKPSNGWHCAHLGLKLLEPQVGEKLPAPEEPIWDAITELYTQLNEQDLFYGLWRRRAAVEDTKTGLVLEQHDCWQSAQEVYYAIMNKGLSGTVRTCKQEADLWEDQWIACAKRLQQWDIPLLEFARTQNNNELLAECVLKVPDWPLLRETVPKLASQDSHIFKLYQGYLAITDSNLTDIDTLSVQGMQIALKKWATLPEVSFNCHLPLLQYFQQILELQESAQIVKELQTTRHQSVDLKSALNIWRDRLPNRWEDVTAWNDIITWRQHVFTHINKAYQNLAELQQALGYIGHHETAWTINKFSHVARKHQLVEYIYTLPNIEIQDAFVKLREQIKCYFQLSTHYRTGLDIINSTNLDYFDNNQKAEFFQLKGEFHHRMGNKEEANVAFNTCMSLSENFAKGWVCWAYFCDHQFSELDPKDPNRILYAENAVQCYMQAVRTHTVHNNKLRYLSRVLWMVSYCANTDGNEAIFSAIDKAAAVLPPWIWIMWIPQLLGSLRRMEFQAGAINILQKIATFFPQALHYPLRAFIAEIELLHFQYQSHKTQTRADTSSDVIMIDVNYNENCVESLQMCLNRARELLHHLHTSHPSLIATIELMMNGIATCAKADPIHALYSSLRSIIHECFKVPSTETPPNVFEMLHSIFQYFSTSSHPSLDPLRPSFEKELLSNEVKGASFVEVIEKIKSWSSKLLNKVEMVLPKNLYLENISTYLLDFHTNNTVNTSIEMPGQYTGEKEPTPEQHALIERFLPEVTHVQENGVWNRVITIMGNNGRAYPFTMYNHNSATQQTHRSTQLLRLLNSILVRHRETCKRGINFVSIPCVFSVSAKVWLVHQPATRDFVSLEDVKIAECYHESSDPDAAIMVHKQRLIEIATGTNKTTKLQVFRDISKSTLPDTVLTKFMSRKHSNFAQIFEIRKYMASQVALHSLVGYVLGSSPKSPENFRFSKSTGTVLPWNISISTPAQQQNLETMPFRLTPNIRTFLGPNIMEGDVIPSMVATSMCFAETKEQLHNFLNLYTYNNHIMTWSDSKPHETLNTVIDTVNQMMGRVHPITPPLQPDKKLYVLPIYKKVSELVAAASNQQSLSQMDAIWQPWL